ncbi:MAG: DUF4390 domain-containing protein [Proteobacteria bacterium]|nr:DUF4390 domain-containing protein [Pseudomonadota bacterium]
MTAWILDHRLLKHALRLLLVIALAGLFGLSRLAWAGTIEPVSAKLMSGEDGYVLSAEFGVDLGSHFEDAVSRGVPLYFVLELEITRNRWYWPSEHIAGRSLNYRLAYIPLTRQYRLSSGGTLHQNFSSLTDALRVLGRVGALPIAERNALKIGETYQVALRLALDRQQLPKPLQVDAIANKDWQVEAKVLHWQFTPTLAAEREAK